MTYIATLVGSCAGALTVAHTGVAQIHFKTSAAPDWLAPGRAADIRLNGVRPSREKILSLRDSFSAQGVSLFVQEEKNRRKSLLVADMESTMVAFEALDVLADMAGQGDQIPKITAKAMNGEIPFRQALEERVALLKGLPVSKLERALQIMLKTINPGARELVSTMKENGAVCVLVTGGFTFFAQSLAERLGFDACHANTLEISGGKLTGRVLEPVLDQDTKLKCLKTYCGIREISLSDAVTIGDGANDLPMLEAAGLGIGYCPKPKVAKAIQHLIPKGGLDAALYAQGYREQDIATAAP
ncbi:MAG: phosphoserine phosphatase SerB [Rhodospirillales bacterium]|nr:phosphoserine phosphatase SerB [Rhodospirillales bacterium]